MSVTIKDLDDHVNKLSDLVKDSADHKSGLQNYKDDLVSYYKDHKMLPKEHILEHMDVAMDLLYDYFNVVDNKDDTNKPSDQPAKDEENSIQMLHQELYNKIALLLLYQNYDKITEEVLLQIKQFLKFAYEEYAKDLGYKIYHKHTTKQGPLNLKTLKRLDYPALYYKATSLCQRLMIHEYFYDVLCQYLKTFDDLNCFELQSLPLDNEKIKQIADSLKHHKNLQFLTVESKEIGEEGAKYLADSLAGLETLRILVLKGCPIGDQGLEALKPLLVRLTNIQLENCCLTDISIKHLEHSFENSVEIQESSELFKSMPKILNLMSNGLTNQGCERLQTIFKGKFDEIHLDGQRPFDFNKLIRYQGSLINKTFFLTKIVRVSYFAIGEFLKTFDDLDAVEISFQKDKLNKDSIKHIADSLKHHKNLKFIALEDITEECVKYLADCLDGLETLKILIIFKSPIGDKGLEALKPLFVRLNHLQLDNCSITDDGIKYLEHAFENTTEMKDPRDETKNIPKKLSLTNNRLTDEGCRHLATIFGGTDRIDELDISKNDITKEGYEKLKCIKKVR